MDRPPFEDLRDAVAGILRDASALCDRVQRHLVPEALRAKADASPVTIADLGTQALLCHRLARSFPGIPVVAEEDTSMLDDAGGEAFALSVLEQVRPLEPDLDAAGLRHAIARGTDTATRGLWWVLDPIDGTKGFLRGDQYAIALGLVEDGEVVFGALACPNLPVDGGRGLLQVAGRGRGAYEAGAAHGAPFRPLRVSGRSAIADLRVVESKEKAHTAQDASSGVREALGIQADPVRIDSQCKYAVVARGGAEVYLRLPTRPGYEEKVWDHAAGFLVTREAGGRVTDVDGKELDFGRGRTLAANAGVVATHGPFHDEVVGAVRRALGRA